MPTLRDHVKETLAAREPDERAARADLAAVMTRIDRPRRRWLYPAIGGPLVAAALVVLVLARRAPPPEPVATGVHLYLHVEGEPADRALAIDLTVQGSHR